MHVFKDQVGADGRTIDKNTLNDISSKSKRGFMNKFDQC